MPQSDPQLDDLRLFVVEDEPLVAMLLESMLESLGCEIVRVTGSVAEALEGIDEIAGDADGAILDVNLGGEMVYPVADALLARGVPFLFATGYGQYGVGDLYPRNIVLAKPYTTAMLAQALVEMRRGRGATRH
jgi:CheY-like chemotaxis protein